MVLGILGPGQLGPGQLGPGGMFANSIRARAHSHGHAHDCRHAHARGYYHGHKKYIIGIAHDYSHFTLAVPMALSTGTTDPTLLKADANEK